MPSGRGGGFQGKARSLWPSPVQPILPRVTSLYIPPAFCHSLMPSNLFQKIFCPACIIVICRRVSLAQAIPRVLDPECPEPPLWCATCPSTWPRSSPSPQPRAGASTNSIPTGRLARMRFKLVKCPTQGYPTGGKSARLVANPTLVQLLALNVSMGTAGPSPGHPQAPLAAFCSSVFLGGLFPLPRLLGAPSRAPRSRQEPHRAMWLWARVSTEQGQSEGLL